MTEYLTHPSISAAARLLVVDDEPNIRTPLARALSLQGYSVEEASSGLEALTLLKHTSYNLMVLDIRMPGMDGVEVMQQAHQLHPELSIIILTGHATLENAISAIKSEAADYLLKPASTHEILTAVAQALQKHPRQLARQRLVHAMSNTLNILGQDDNLPTSPSVPKSIPERFVRVFPLTLDCQTRWVAVNVDSPYMVELSIGETAILASLMAKPDHILSCRELVRLAWNQNMQEAKAQRLVRPHISRLRRKLEANPKTPHLICTVRQRGYYFASTKEVDSP